MEGILIPIAFFAFVLAIIAMKHKQRLEELRVIRGQGAGVDVSNELQKLQQQIHELRDTTTRYDMSFDAALQRLESRMTHLETQQREGQAQIGVGQGQQGG